MPENSKRILLLFTSSFPYGKGEQFLETEIIFLARAFKEVHVFPRSVEGELRNLPPNVKLVHFRHYAPYNAYKVLFANLFFVWRCWRIEMKLSPNRNNYKKQKKFFLLYLLHRLNDAGKLAKVVLNYDQKSIVLYSYWFNTWVTLLALLKLKGLVRLPILTRAHGGDYDESQARNGFYTFRSLEMTAVDAIFPVSVYGRNYIVKRFPYYAGMTKTHYLGVMDHGDNPPVPTDHFHIVSCSFLIPLKRVHLIVEILRRLELKIKWTHIGEGELMDEIMEKASALPSNITVSFKGHLPNSEVLEFYGAEHIDLFMNVSELEGVPVSIMEAISFGIPVTGCNICGVPEIVTSQTGFLFEKNIDVEQAARLLREYFLRDVAYRDEFRKKVKLFWQERFNAGTNYPQFISSALK